MKIEWQLRPASSEGPATLEAEVGGARIVLAERGNHWHASVAYDDGQEWTVSGRTRDEVETRALRRIRGARPDRS